MSEPEPIPEPVVESEPEPVVEPTQDTGNSHLFAVRTTGGQEKVVLQLFCVQKDIRQNI